MKKKTKAIIAGIVLLLMVTGGIFAYLSFFHQPSPVVRDHTQNGQKGPENQKESASNTEEQNIAVFSPGVNMFSQSESDQINDAIDNYYITNQGLILTFDSDSPMDTLGVGDIFYLEGDSTTPFGETYIGKIISESESNGVTTYVIDDPAIDEVFDVLNIDCSKMLTNENITQIRTVEGVTVRGMGTSLVASAGAYANEGYAVTTLGHYTSNQPATNLSSFGDSELVFEFNLDLFKAFGMDGSTKTDSKVQDIYENRDGDAVTVYLAPSGTRYHKASCAFLKKGKVPLTLRAAVIEEYEPCLKCKAPLLTDDSGLTEFEPSLMLTGKLGVDNVLCDVEFDWDILSGNGIEDASVNISGDIVGELALKANLEFEFGGRDTVIRLPANCVKLQGLSEKLFPIGFVGYNFTSVVTAVGNDAIHAQTSAFPITVAMVIYVDASGKVSLGTKASLNYTNEFNYSHILIQDGKWIDQKDGDFGEGKITVGLEAELAGDLDLHAGASLMLYVFNLNPMEVAIAKFGTEAEGSLKIAYDTDTEPTDDVISSSYYMRVYLKLLELNLKLKAKVSLGSWSLNPLSANLSAIVLDQTIFECGSKNQTRYKPGEMGYSVLTAYDTENYYYKDTSGDLIKECDSIKTVLYSDGFFTICGIDESYIYILRNNPDISDTHDIYRISKYDGTGKKIVSEVKNCLTMDEEYVYYVSNFDSSTILRMNRQTLKEQTFYTSSGEIRYMSEQDGGFYVAMVEDDMFSWLFGSEPEYLLLNRDGVVVTEYDSNPSVPSLQLSQLPDYYYATKIISSGYLRNQAEAVYWLSSDRVRYERVEGISGWNADNEGIFTTVEDESGGYKIVMYRAQDGQRVDVTDVQSDHAFFTLCQGSSGNWFFFDQTEDSLILYTMDENFGNKTVVKTFSLSEIPYNLTNCGMTIMADRIYFYTIQDNTTSHVLYRYDII